VLQELTPGKGKNSFSFVDGNVNGRELFVTKRKPAAKRGRPRKKNDENGEVNETTPKRGRPRKRDELATPGTASPKRKTPTKRAIPQEVTEPVDMEDIEVIDLQDGTETSQAEVDEREGFEDGDQSGFDTTNNDDTGGFDTTNQDFDFPTPMRDTRDETPLPVEPYRSFHSFPPSSPVYEEYQVPIPTSSSPVRPFSEARRPQTPASPFQTPTPNDQARRRKARSRSASRERRMSFAPIPDWQGLPSTPRRTGSEESDESDRVSQSTKSTEIPSPIQPPNIEVRQTVYSAEGMTPTRNWAAELAAEAFQFDQSPSKIVQLPIESQVKMRPSVTVEDEVEEEEENEYNDEEHGYMEDEEEEVDFSYSYSNTFLKDSYPSTPKPIPQISRLRESPIVITSSPPDEPAPIHYQWKTKVVSPLPTTPQQTPSSPPPVSEHSSSPEISLSQCRISSRQSSPARSILTDLGDDVVDISSVSPLAAKRAANILLQTQYYSKITFDDGEGRKVWEEATSQAGDFELHQLDLPSDIPSLDDEDEEEEEEEEMKVEVSEQPPRISDGPWNKLDWKRMEKCLDLTDGDINDAIELFQERYIGRGREEVEMRCRAVLLTRRRKALEGRKVGFVLATDE